MPADDPHRYVLEEGGSRRGARRGGCLSFRPAFPAAGTVPSGPAHAGPETVSRARAGRASFLEQAGEKGQDARGWKPCLFCLECIAFHEIGDVKLGRVRAGILAIRGLIQGAREAQTLAASAVELAHQQRRIEQFQHHFQELLQNLVFGEIERRAPVT